MARLTFMTSSISSDKRRWLSLWPLAVLVILCVAYWSKVLWTDEVLLPGAMLRGFAPFGADSQAPWTILQWDALAQYYPWRLFVARQLQDGFIPLWNPHQLAGTPLMANGQSAVFYPLNLPFWTFDVARAFGISALIHSLLATISTYCLAQRWQMSRAASCLAAIGFGFCGYLAAWVVLPTLSNTASWLPLLILLLEKAHQERRLVSSALVGFAVALCCALLAGHAQVFIYLVLALTLRALLLPPLRRSLAVLCVGGLWAALLSGLQILPTLELARLGHRAAMGGPTVEGWQFIANNALQPAEFLTLLLPNWPSLRGTLNESFGYVGFGLCLLVLLGLAAAGRVMLRTKVLSPLLFAALLALSGLLFAFATPLPKFFYFYVPGLSQMGGVGRALLWWSFGVAMLAAWGFDVIRRRVATSHQSTLRLALSLLMLGFVTGELWFNGLSAHPTAPRNSIYPQTTLTSWLKEHLRPNERVLFLTPRNSWLPTELLQTQGVAHPPGVLPPNGATVYGINDVNGYDSLAPLAYRQFVNAGEGHDVSPPLNGNMMLLENTDSPTLDAFQVRYVVALETQSVPLPKVLSSDGCAVYERPLKTVATKSGEDFYPGWKDGRYQPETFRVGTFLTFCALTVASAVLYFARLRNDA
jgi:hypothetical protein